MCHLRSVAPPAAYTLLLAVTLARVLLLATADSDGLPGHASGGLQLVIMLLLLAVEAALLVQGGLLRTEAYLSEERRGRAGLSVCREAGWSWLARLLWPAVLLALQTLLTPWVWSSRRNYREGLLMSLASIAITCLAAAWVAIYVLCAGFTSSPPLAPTAALYINMHCYRPTTVAGTPCCYNNHTGAMKDAYQCSQKQAIHATQDLDFHRKT